MLEIKIYSNIVSNMFGVIIAVNFLFCHSKKILKNCKWVVTVEKMELGSFGGEGEIM